MMDVARFSFLPWFVYVKSYHCRKKRSHREICCGTKGIAPQNLPVCSVPDIARTIRIIGHGRYNCRKIGLCDVVQSATFSTSRVPIVAGFASTIILKNQDRALWSMYGAKQVQGLEKITPAVLSCHYAVSQTMPKDVQKNYWTNETTKAFWIMDLYPNPGFRGGKNILAHKTGKKLPCPYERAVIVSNVATRKQD